MTTAVASVDLGEGWEGTTIAMGRVEVVVVVDREEATTVTDQVEAARGKEMTIASATPALDKETTPAAASVDQGEG